MIFKTALEGQEISAIEALLLLQQERSALPELFRVADQVNRRLHGDVVTYANACHVSYSNICKSGCRTCSFQRKKNAPDAYALPIEEVLEKIDRQNDVAAIHLEGGLNPDLPFDYLRELLRETRRRFPTAQIRAFSPVEVYYYARKQRLSFRDLLAQWKDDGLDVLPGTAAEILNDKLRKKICPDKLRTSDWVDVIRTAHRVGIPTTATMLFGHLENEVHIIEHLDIVRNLQKETGGFLEFIPLPFLPDGSALARNGQRTEIADIDEIFRVFALSRIFYSHTIPNLSAPWPILGLDAAVRSLSLGVNDLGSLAYDEDLVHAPAVTQLAVTPTALGRMVRKAGRSLRVRDFLFKDNAPVAPQGRAALAHR